MLLVDCAIAYTISRFLPNVFLYFVAVFCVSTPQIPDALGVYALGSAALFWLGWPFHIFRTPFLIALVWLVLYSLRLSRQQALLAVLNHSIQWLVLYLVSLYPLPLAFVAALCWPSSREYSAPVAHLLLLRSRFGWILFTVASCLRFDHGRVRLVALAALSMSSTVKLCLASIQWPWASDSGRFWTSVSYIALGCLLLQPHTSGDGRATP